MSVRERERKEEKTGKQTEVEEEEQRRGRRSREGSVALHNRPRHECSSTLVSTHPLQFQLSNGTSDSRHPLTLCTKDGRVRAHSNSSTHEQRDTNVYEHVLVTYAHTQKTQAHAVMERLEGRRSVHANTPKLTLALPTH